MPWWKVLLIVLAICLPCIVVLEVISRLGKYRAKVTKGLFDLDKRAQECPDAEVEQLWSDVCWFEVDTYKTHFQHLKMISIMAYVQARRAHIKRDDEAKKKKYDTIAAKVAGGQATAAPPSDQSPH